MDTIFAQSSRPGKAGISVFRISGKDSILAIGRLLKTSNVKLSPKLMYHKKIYDIESDELIDHAMIVYFKAPASFTGEDVVEIHTHGSLSIAKMLTKVLLNIEGLRMAEPGEFARRAFLNGKFDLTAAEGFADLIEAETIWQHRQALRQAGGELEKLYNSWRQQLLNVISLLEAYIDFPDEDIPDEVLLKVTLLIENLKQTITDHLNDKRRGELLRNGIKLAIIGEPNVGKSSLLNFLMRRELAIVSNIAGTTRDIIEGHLDIGGYPIILQDTAGIRKETKDIIEREGIKRALESAKNANIKIIMFDATSSTQLSFEILKDINKDNSIFVVNKIDLTGEGKDIIINNKESIKISIKEKIGLDLLLKEIERIASNIAGLAESPQITRERHRHQLQQALEYLTNFNLENDLVLATEDIRMTIRALSNITGKITVEEILGEIFANFCIGK